MFLARTSRATRWPRPALLVLASVLLLACGGDDGGTGPQGNRAPEIDTTRQIVVSTLNVLVPGDVVGFDLRAVDPDIQPVSYSWSLSPATATGSFDDASVRDPQWTVGDLRGDVTVTCVVSDGALSDTWTRTFEVGTKVEAAQIAGAVTWAAADGPYVLTGNIVVEATGTLTVEAGTRVYSRPLQSFQGGSSVVTLRSIQVFGSLIMGDASGTTTLLTGGWVDSARPDQHAGVAFVGSGSGTFSGVRVDKARTGIQHSGTGTVVIQHQSLLTDNTENGILMSAQVGGRLEVRDTQISDSALGLAATSGVVEFERVRLSGNTTAASVATTFTAIDCVFGVSVGGHLELRILGTSPAIVQVDVSGSNFLAVSTGGPAVNVAEGACSRLDLELRGNYWGTNLTADQIQDRFARREVCNAGVASWTDSDCGDASCDWSNEPFN